KLRSEGLREPAEAAEAWMEGDGHVSVIKKPQLAQGPARTAPAGTLQSHNGTADGASNGVPPEPPRPEIEELRAFLEAARKLEDRVARHRQAITEHQAEIAEIREVLGR